MSRLALCLLVAVVGLASSQQICEQYGTTNVGGKYIVMNNRWGTSAEQCIDVSGTGFKITRQEGQGNLGGAPVSYPAIYYGCHYSNCSPGTSLPLKVSDIRTLQSTIAYTFINTGTYDAAYDIWLDPNPNTSSVNAQEIMIWFNRQGQIQPVGSQTGTANIAGKTWQVWTGNNGQNAVLSFVADGPITSMTFSVLDFINDGISRGLFTNSWYLTSIQGGFEPWIGGVGLGVTNFDIQVN